MCVRGRGGGGGGGGGRGGGEGGGGGEMGRSCPLWQRRTTCLTSLELPFGQNLAVSSTSRRLGRQALRRAQRNQEIFTDTGSHC